MGVYDRYENLKKSERDFLWNHPLAAIDFNANASAARDEAKRRFSEATLHNGSGDAFRHCFWFGRGSAIFVKTTVGGAFALKAPARRE